MGTRSPRQRRTIATTSAVLSGRGDDVGRALVEGVHVALVDKSPFRGGDEAVRAEDPPELVEETGT